MKFFFSAFIAIAAVLLTPVNAHSWVDCVKDEVKNYDAVKANPNLTPDVICHGFPRNKVNNGDWIAESTNYLWDLGSAAAKDGHACHPSQRQPTYPDKVPAAKAKAGEILRIRYWGNGHASWHWGAPIHKDPGLVRVYYAGKKDAEITMVSELTLDKMMVESNFSADAVTRPKEGNKPDDKALWMKLALPKSLKNGRHMFVWTWAPLLDDFGGVWRDRYTTCFDVFIDGMTNGPDPAPSKPSPAQNPTDKSKSIAEKCAAKCLRGGQPNAVCTGANCPPCRIGESCYDYVQGTKDQCPFSGVFDCIKKIQVN